MNDACNDSSIRGPRLLVYQHAHHKAKSNNKMLMGIIGTCYKQRGPTIIVWSQLTRFLLHEICARNAIPSITSCLFKVRASEKNICDGKTKSLSIQAMINKKRLLPVLFVFSQNLSLCEIF